MCRRCAPRAASRWSAPVWRTRPSSPVRSRRPSANSEPSLEVSCAEMLAGWQQIDWDLDVDITYVTNLSPFVPWDVLTYPNESSLSDEQLRNLIVQIVTAEGPMICSRLYDLVFEPRGPGLRVDSTSLSTAGRAFGTDVLPRSSRSAEGSRTRPSTSRAKIHAFSNAGRATRRLSRSRSTSSTRDRFSAWLSTAPCV